MTQRPNASDSLCILLGPLFFGLSGCLAESTAPSGQAGEVEPPSVELRTSYLRDIQPIVERSCLSCHVAGGVAPFSFEDPEAVAALAPAMLGSIRSGRMPPFYASADCNDYEHDPRLSPNEVELFEAWVEEGAPMGDSAEARHGKPLASPPIRHDVVLDIGGEFDARLMDADDNYRCFQIDLDADEDFMVTGYEVLPGNPAIVHHVLAYIVPPRQVDDLEAKDAEDPGLGYTCFSGGVGIPGALQNQVAAWVPGAGPLKLPEGTGLLVEAGSKIVAQVHYTLLNLGDQTTIDKTHIALQTDAVEGLTRAQILPAIKRNLKIEAGDAESVQEAMVPNFLFGSNTTLYRLTGHMHLLGKQVRLEVLHPDGSKTCLLDIPRWDFQWQREYTLSQPVKLERGDRLKIRCVYDNSAENQPVVDGEQQVPREVRWGESSLAEMCMTYVVFTKE